MTYLLIQPNSNETDLWGKNQNWLKHLEMQFICFCENKPGNTDVGVSIADDQADLISVEAVIRQAPIGGECLGYCQ